MLCATYALTSMAVSEVTIQEFDLRAGSTVHSVGRVIAMVVAGATILRAVWSFQDLFNKAVHKSFPTLVFTLFSNFLKCCTCGRKEGGGKPLDGYV
jgi:hypothetical protein